MRAESGHQRQRRHERPAGAHAEQAAHRAREDADRQPAEYLHEAEGFEHAGYAAPCSTGASMWSMRLSP